MPNYWCLVVREAAVVGAGQQGALIQREPNRDIGKLLDSIVSIGQTRLQLAGPAKHLSSGVLEELTQLVNPL